MSNKTFLDELNPSQRAAVEHINGPSLVIAGAGSGKTKVLTFKIAWLLMHRVDPRSILALTFTNKAAKEMKERIARITGYQIANQLWMGTFHSRFSVILRKESDKLGFPQNFTIYDTTDSKNAIKQIIKDLKLDDKIYKPNEILGRISYAKNNLITAASYAANDQLVSADKHTRRPEIQTIYRLYTARCKASGAMDFDDLLLYTNLLFRDFPDVLEKYQNSFRYILVDEYQDTNFAQYLIIKRLSEKHHNLCVVGDDAQSIYAFRGAKIENILNFRNDYPDYQLFKLEQNYRSTQTIVNAANSLIAKNKEQIQKKVFSKKEAGNPIQIMESYTDREEGIMIANYIAETALKNQIKFKDFAILYRTNAQSRIFEESLRKENIPYRIYGGLSFYQRKEVKDLLAYFRLAVNHNDDEAFRRVVNYPARGIGKTTLSKVDEMAHIQSMSIWELLSKIHHFNHSFNKPTLTKLHEFMKLIQRFSDGIENKDAYDAAYQMATETGILKELSQDKTPESISRYENIQELLNGIKDFTTLDGEDKSVPLSEYLQNVALLTDADNDNEGEDNKVNLMTIHSAKGLEFKNVIIVGMEEGLFPSLRSASMPHELEEERRLFYVAITRAEQELVISHTKSRYIWGSLEACRPSRFLKDINSEYLEQSQGLFGKPAFPGNPFQSFDQSRKSFGKTTTPERVAPPQPKPHLKPVKSAPSVASSGSSSNSFSEPEVGSRVKHERFGIGTVLKLEGDQANRKATVEFPVAGTKQLLLKFAKLEAIN